MVQLKTINDISPIEIQQLANNYVIKKNLRDSFPFPYLIEDATSFLKLESAGLVGHVFAIVSNNNFIGIGLKTMNIDLTQRLVTGLENLTGVEDMRQKQLIY
jgi:hypothetical protein